jgi:type I restriction enzyme R subunit
LVAPSKYAAVMFKKALDMLGDINSEVIISETLSDEGKDDVLAEHKKLVTDYMVEQKHKYGSAETREKQIIQDYKKNPEGCELLIVVDKLLTGFDAPRDSVLYLAKQLKDHNLLQAIARVNRVFDGDVGKQSKTAGLIVDYSKNAKNLKNALELFSNYEPGDIENALLDTDSQVALLNDIFARLHDVFRDVEDRGNTNAYIEFLKAHEKERETFYEDVNKFIKQFSVCYSLYDFYEKMDADRLLSYKKDLKRFIEIKKTTQLAMAEKVDFSKYKDQILKLLDKYVTAQEVEVLSKEISLSDAYEFNQYIEDDKNGLSDKSKADAILAQTKKIIKEKYEQDEVFYGRFSELIDKLLNDLKNAKKEDLAALLNQAKGYQKSVTDYVDSDIPERLRARKIYHPFYRNIHPFIQTDDENYTQIVEHIVEIIKSRKVVDFQNNTNVKREVFWAIEDYLDEDVDENLSAETIEQITQTAWNIAVQNEDFL